MIHNLNEIDFTNKWFGTNATLLKALRQVFKHYDEVIQTRSILMADIGCGSGAHLSAIFHWVKHLVSSVQILAIDANEHIIEHAKLNHAFQHCEFKVMNVHDKIFNDQTFDIVMLNNLCHHLTDEELISFISRLKKQTRLAVIINDLHRHRLPYYSFKVISCLLGFSRISKHDGAISIKRAFLRSELQALMKKCNISSYSLSWSWAFRWKLIIWCQ